MIVVSGLTDQSLEVGRANKAGKEKNGSPSASSQSSSAYVHSYCKACLKLNMGVEANSQWCRRSKAKFQVPIMITVAIFVSLIDAKKTYIVTAVLMIDQYETFIVFVGGGMPSPHQCFHFSRGLDF